MIEVTYNKQELDDWVKNIIREDFTWASKRLLEYLQNQLDKIKDEKFVITVTKQNAERVKKNQLACLQNDLNKYNQEYIELYNDGENLIKKYTDEKDKWVLDLILEDNKIWMEKIIKKIKTITFEINCWNNPTILLENNRKGVTEEEIEIAKNVDWEIVVPDSVMSSSGRRLTTCLWHQDSNPSLLLYPDSKGCYCFSCNTASDTIGYLMEKDKLNFIEAVKLLNNF
jgi:hypothetical protein